MSDFIYPATNPDGSPVGSDTSQLSIKAKTPSSRTYKVGGDAVGLPEFTAVASEPGNVMVTFTATTGAASFSDSATGTFLPEFVVSGDVDDVNVKLRGMFVKVDAAEQGTVSYMVEIEDSTAKTAKAPELYQVLNESLNDPGQGANATITVSGSSGTIQLKVNSKIVSKPIPFTTDLSTTVDKLVESINDNGNVPKYKATKVGDNQLKIEAPVGYGEAANDFTVDAVATGTMSISGDTKLANGRDKIEPALSWGDKLLKSAVSALPTVGAALVGGLIMRNLGKVEVNVASSDGVPQVAVIYEGIMVPVPNNYEPGDQAIDGTWSVLPSWDRAAWDKATFTEKYTTNPAWCLYEFINNKRWGCGNSIKFTDAQRARFLDEIADAAVYCDGQVDDGTSKGKMEPRFTLNTQINGMSRLEVIDALCSTMNAMVVFTDDGIRLRQDTPNGSTSRVVTNANVGNGDFKVTGGSANALYNYVEVTWNNPAQNYQHDVAISYDAVSVAQSSERKTAVTAFGCTSSGQARRKAKYIEMNEKSDPLTVTYVAGLDHSDIVPGDLVVLHDNTFTPNGSKRMGGRVMSNPTPTTVVLDRAIEFAENHRMYFNRADGSVTNRTVTAVNTVNGISTVTLANALPDQLNPDAYTKAAFIYCELDAPLYYKVVMITERSSGIYEVSAIKHDFGKYAIIDSPY